MWCRYGPSPDCQSLDHSDHATGSCLCEQIGPECFRAPELLFDPSLLGLEYPGVHECLNTAIMRSDLDLRRTLYSQIVLAGGSTLFKGNRLFCVCPHVVLQYCDDSTRKYNFWQGLATGC
jgi:actin-related protein